jgi:predicted ATPase with chaperone activity
VHSSRLALGLFLRPRIGKEGPSFDLPIALAMLQLNEQNRILGLHHFYLCGELALSGELRPVKGTLAIALKARKLRRVRLSTDVVTKGIDAKSALLRYNA